MRKVIFSILFAVLAVITIGQTKLNKSLIALPDTIYNEDQSDRLKIDSLTKQFEWQSKQLDSLFRKMSHQDSIFHQ